MRRILFLLYLALVGACRAGSPDPQQQQIPNEVATFFDHAFAAISSRDVNWLAENVALPFCIIDESGERIDVATKEALKSESVEIFTPEFVAALNEHRKSPLFTNWQGYAAADGLIWAEGASGSYEITKINSPAVVRCYKDQPRVSE